MQDTFSITLMLVGPSIILPFALSLALQLGVNVARQQLSLNPSTHRRGIHPAIMLNTGVMVSFLLAFKLIYPALGFPPAQALDGILILTILGGIYAALTLHRQCHYVVRISLQLCIIVLGEYLLMKPLFSQWTMFTSMINGTVTLLLWLATWNALEQLAKRPDRHLLSSTLVALPAGAAPVIAIGGTLLIGQITTALTASLAAFWLLNLWRHEPQQLNGLIAAVIAPFGGLLIMAYQYADVNLAALLLILSVIIITRLYRQALSIEHRQKLSHLIPFILCLMLPIGISIWLIWPETSLY